MASIASDDLTGLDSPTFVKKIQALLEEKTSDSVRQILEDYNINLPRAIYTKGYDNIKVTPADVLDSPFFTVAFLAAVARETPSKRESMSHDISKTAKKVLDGFYSFNVHFKTWSTYSDDIDSEGSPELLASITEVQARQELCALLNRTHFARLVYPGEEREMALLENSINPVLKLFGFTFANINGSLHDFEFLKGTDGVLYGEAKECSMLPCIHINDAHELCLFGFATKIAKSSTQTTSTMDTEYRELKTLLGFKDTVVSELLARDYSVSSELAGAILRREGDIVQVAANVLERARSAKTGPTDAMNMWAGVMQTCLHAVIKRRTLSIVMKATTIIQHPQTRSERKSRRSQQRTSELPPTAPCNRCHHISSFSRHRRILDPRKVAPCPWEIHHRSGWQTLEWQFHGWTRLAKICKSWARDVLI
jgi:hypothetical protein